MNVRLPKHLRNRGIDVRVQTLLISLQLWDFMFPGVNPCFRAFLVWMCQHAGLDLQCSSGYSEE